jgi:hypothetical protein
MALRSFCWDFMAIRRRDVQPRSFVRTRRAEPVHYAAAAPVAQLDRASGFEEVNGWFESVEMPSPIKMLRVGSLSLKSGVTKPQPR